MRRASALWEVFVLRFAEALERYRKRRLTAEEAGELLGISGRHFRRLLVRYEKARNRGAARPAAGPALATAGGSGRTDPHADPLPGTLPRFHGEAFPRAAAAAA